MMIHESKMRKQLSRGHFKPERYAMRAKVIVGGESVAPVTPAKRKRSRPPG